MLPFQEETALFFLKKKKKAKHKRCFGEYPILFNKLSIESSLSQTSKKSQNLHEHAKLTAGVPLKSSHFYRSVSNEKKPVVV